MAERAANMKLIFNGIDFATGDYAIPPMEIDAFVELVKRQSDPPNWNELKSRKRLLEGRDFAPIEGVDPKKLEESGWGVIFPHNIDEAIVAALKPLLDLRKGQASKIKENRYREYSGGLRGFQAPSDTKNDWLSRNKADGGGAVDPDQMPYYLMIVGSPVDIPFTFQYQLDVQFAVGRLHFDAVEDYALYAQAVVAAETGRLAVAKRAVFFGVSVDNDPATMLSSSELTIPLAEQMQADQPGWTVETIIGQDANKARLARLMGGDDTPALLFTASHGMQVAMDDPAQFKNMGALLCAEWPGPGMSPKPMPEKFYFGGDDILSQANLAGLIAFHFACFGGGTPTHDDFVREGAKEPKQLAAQPFVAHMPQRLLRGGALASVGHVDRAWAYAFKSESGSSQVRIFKSTMKRLMEGHPIGSALEYFNNRYAELGSDVAQQIRAARFGTAPDPFDLSYRWLITQDARNYAVMGDPAVRLFVTDDARQVKRPVPQAIAFAGPVPEPAANEPVAAKTLEVTTYTSPDPAGVKFSSEAIAGATLQAITRIDAHGNITNVLMEKLDATVARVHADLVAKAMDRQRG